MFLRSINGAFYFLQVGSVQGSGLCGLQCGLAQRCIGLTFLQYGFDGQCQGFLLFIEACNFLLQPVAAANLIANAEPVIQAGGGAQCFLLQAVKALIGNVGLFRVLCLELILGFIAGGQGLIQDGGADGRWPRRAYARAGYANPRLLIK